MKLKAGLTAAWTLIASAGLASDDFWFVVNEDNDHFFKCDSSEMTEKGLTDYLDYVLRGKVTHFVMCVNGQRTSYSSKTWEPIWAGLNDRARKDTATHPDGTHDRWAVNAKKLFDAGIDPYGVWIGRCREKGVSPWISMRMNDVHWGDDVTYFRNTTFYKTHPEWRIEPGEAKHGWHSWQLDFARPEVRAYNLAQIREIAERWDSDGIELDWLRFGNAFRYGHEREDAPIMDDFIRTVRGIVDEAGRKHGRKMGLAVRMHASPAESESLGFNVIAWAKAGLMDVIVPDGFGYAVPDLPVKDWLAQLKGTNVRLVPGTGSFIPAKLDYRKFPAALRGLVEHYCRQGATGAYFFNLPYASCPKYATDGCRDPEVDPAAELYTRGVSPEDTAHAEKLLYWIPGARSQPMRVVLTFDDGLKDHLLIAAPELEKRGWRGVFNVVTDWVGKSDKYLTWDEVRELVRRGHEVTTHTASHPNLRALLKAGKADEARREIARSRDEIADRTGFAPRLMCAPYMQQNAETARLCREENLRQMDVTRHNFGSANQDRVADVVTNEVAKGRLRMDLLHHGVSAADHGGWCSFPDRTSFSRHLDRIAEMERRGILRVTDYDGCAADCALKAESWPHHGVVALSFDDRNLADWERAFPLFGRYGATATFCISGEIDTNAVVFARKALRQGHEIALHGLRHRNADTAVAEMGEEEYWEVEMNPQIVACKAVGIPVRSFAYPNCRHSEASDALFARHGFTRLRGSIPGVKSPNPYDPKGEKLERWHPVAEVDPFFVPTREHLAERNISNVILGESYHTDIEDVLRAMNRAGSRAELLSLVSHGIAPDAKGISLKTEWLERILSAADASGVVVRGLR